MVAFVVASSTKVDLEHRFKAECMAIQAATSTFVAVIKGSSFLPSAIAAVE